MGRPELDILADQIDTLSKVVYGLYVDLRQVQTHLSAALDRGWELSIRPRSLGIRGTVSSSGTDVQLKVMLEASYRGVAQRLTKIRQAQRKAYRSLQHLSAPVASALPNKQGSTWRSYYLRTCLDPLLNCPPELKDSPFVEGVQKRWRGDQVAAV